jgi:hypothetical protein
MRTILKTMVLICTLTVYCSADGCGGGSESNSTPVNLSYSDTIIGKDSLAAKNGIITEFKNYYDRADPYTYAYLGVLYNNYFSKLDTSIAIFERISNLDTNLHKFSVDQTLFRTEAGTTIKSIFPPRDPSLYEINGTELLIKDPISFWHFYRFCIIILEDPISDFDNTISNNLIDTIKVLGKKK